MAKNNNRNSNGEGSSRQLTDGSWECIIQSKYLNPETNKPKRIKRKGKTEKEAVKNCKQALLIWEKMYESNSINKVDKKRTFGSYMEEFIDSIVKKQITASSYKSYIYAMNANFYNYKISTLQLSMLNTVEFELYYDHVIHDKSWKTASFPIQLCIRCCEWLLSKSLIAENYAAFAKPKRQKRDEYFREKDKDNKPEKEFYTNEDIVKFYNSYKNNMSEYSPVIVLMLETMMRGQEVLALTLDDIDLENNTITIRSAISERFVDNDKEKGLEKYIKVTKTSDERTIYMTPLAKEIILYLIDQTKIKCRQNPNNLLFPSYLKHGKHRSMDAFEIQFKVLCDKLGIDRDVRPHKMPNGKVVNKGLCVHALRHTAITIANTAPNANVINTALMAGHTAIRTENIYTHANIESMKNIASVSNTVLNLDKTNENKEDDITEEEMYKLFLKLKEKYQE